MPRPRLYVHIGLQKTGTSYLQSMFWASADSLREQGLDMVPGTLRETFWLMLDVRGRYDADLDPAAAGRSVDRLPELLSASTGTRALLTEESLAPATDDQIARLLSRCGSHEVHVVVTARDLARQIPSSWQQRLQAGSDEPFAEYLARLRQAHGKRSAAGPMGAWRQKDVAGVLARWSRHVPAERCHLVTVPPSGSEPDLLLRRFCSLLDVDPERLDGDRTRPNEGLGHVGAELLRRVNAGLDPELRRRQVYGAVGKRYFAHQVLGPESGRRIRMPAELADWTTEVAREQVARLREGGFTVVGDLEDLVPRPSAFTDEPVEPSDAELAEEATRALSRVLGDQLAERLQGERRRRTPSAPAGESRLGSRLRGGVRRLRVRR